jgi:hypothetical protein
VSAFDVSFHQTTLSSQARQLLEASRHVYMTLLSVAAYCKCDDLASSLLLCCLSAARYRGGDQVAIYGVAPLFKISRNFLFERQSLLFNADEFGVIADIDRGAGRSSHPKAFKKHLLLN